MRRACFAVSAAVIVFAMGCSRGPTSPSRAVVEPAGTQTASTTSPKALFGASSVDFGRCLQRVGDPGCFAGARIQLGAAGVDGIVGDTPTGLTATAVGNTVTLSWTFPAGGGFVFYVEAGSTPGAADLAGFFVGSQKTFFATGIPAGSYYVRVRAAYPSGFGPPSNEVLLTVGGGGCAAAPNAPSGLAIPVTGSTVTMTWSAPAGGCTPTSYVLQAGSSAGLSNLANSNVGNTTSYVATGVGNGTYYVRVRAANAYGQSEGSNEVPTVVGPVAPTAIDVQPRSYLMGTSGGCNTSNLGVQFLVSAPADVSWTVSWYGADSPPEDNNHHQGSINRSSGTGSGAVNFTVTVAAQRPSDPRVFNCGNWYDYYYTDSFAFRFYDSRGAQIGRVDTVANYFFRLIS